MGWSGAEGSARPDIGPSGAAAEGRPSPILAGRIVGGNQPVSVPNRTHVRLSTLVVAVGLTLAACGGGEAGVLVPIDPTPTPSPPPPAEPPPPPPGF